jgi:transcriptional regulator with XRE-family HTH domain
MRAKNSRRGIYDAIGGAVREARGRRRLTQQELGWRAGLHRNYVGAVERGEINPTLRIIVRLARGLAMQPSELLNLAEQHHGGWDLDVDDDVAPRRSSSSRRRATPSRGRQS